MRVYEFHNKLNEYFKGNIKLSFVFEFFVIIITKKDDKFYRFDKGNNSLRSNNKTFILLRDHKSNIDSLIHNYLEVDFSYKSIIDYKYSFDFTVARTSDGHLYCWDSSSWGEISDSEPISSRPNPKIYKPQSNIHLRDKNIIDICCGFKHLLALSSDGDVYAWGGNQFGEIGNGNNEYQSLPFRLEGFDDLEIKAISAGFLHSMALTKCGHVFTWGSNKWGQLGVEKLESSNRPVMIETDVVFDKISCSAQHNLLLTRNGDIYVFGINNLGQLGNDNKQNRYTPCPLSIFSGANMIKFKDIASNYVFDISVALSENGFCYVWGKCGAKDDAEVITSPRKTKHKTFNEVFSYYFDITYVPTREKVSRFKDLSLLYNGFYDFYFHKNGIEDLGRGSFGFVYKVEKRKCAPDGVKLQREFYAVKKIKFESDNEIEFIKELSTSRTIFQLQSDNLVKYYDTWLENESIEDRRKTQIFNKNLTLHIQMELCDRNLQTMINEIQTDQYLYKSSSGTLTQLGNYLVVELFLQIVKGVDYLHKHKIIHRDLKPKNIMLKIEEDSYYFVKICDYGIIAILEYKEKITNEIKSVDENHPEKFRTTNVGDLDYAAPEVLYGDGKYDTKADIYSIGRVLLDLFYIKKDDYQKDVVYRNDIKNKMPEYHYLIDLWDKMLDEKPTERPDCDEIIHRRHELSLTLNEFDPKKELNEVPTSYKSYAFELLNIRIKFKKRSLPDMHIANTYTHDSLFRIREGIKEVLNSVELAERLISIESVNDSLLELRASITGPPDTPYDGEIFHLEIKVSKHYALDPPEIRFLTKICHPDICYVTGAIRLDVPKRENLEQSPNSLKARLLQLMKALAG